MCLAGRETTEDKAELQAEGGGVVVGVAGEEVGVADIKEGGWVEVKRNKKDHESHVPRRSMRLFGSSGGIERYLYRESESEDDSDYEPEHWRKVGFGNQHSCYCPLLLPWQLIFPLLMCVGDQHRCQLPGRCAGLHLRCSRAGR